MLSGKKGRQRIVMTTFKHFFFYPKVLEVIVKNTDIPYEMIKEKVNPMFFGNSLADINFNKEIILYYSGKENKFIDVEDNDLSEIKYLIRINRSEKEVTVESL